MKIKFQDHIGQWHDILIQEPGVDVGYMKPCKPKEFIDITEDLSSKLSDCIPMHGEFYNGDIFIAGKYPSPDIEMRIHEPRGIITGRVTPYSHDEIYNQIKRFKCSGKTIGETMDDLVICGEVQITTYFEYDKKQLTAYCPILIDPSNMCICWRQIDFQVPEIFAEIFRYNNPKNAKASNNIFAALINAYQTILMSWIGIQIMLLNPVIAYRCKRETVVNSLDKSNCKKNSKKKGPKKYIKRITLDDLSDLEFGKKSTKHIKEPFWWVSGHRRTYKSGREIFIEGYWKGPFREYGYVDQPRERQIEFGSSTDQSMKDS